MRRCRRTASSTRSGCAGAEGEGEGEGEPCDFPTIAGLKYYDTNLNGQWDPGEPRIGGWKIDIHDVDDATDDVITTAADGTFLISVLDHDDTLAEQDGGPSWIQTGNTVDQLVTAGGATATLLADMSYEVSMQECSSVSGVNFGNVCLGAGGGHTIGFWSNKNGGALVDAGDLAALNLLPLVDGDGNDVTFANHADLKSFLLGANAVNMANMLSAQLAAMVLNVLNGFVDPDALVYAPGTASADALGFATIHDLILEAIDLLQSDPLTVGPSAARTAQEAVKNALDAANNNQSFVQEDPEDCPEPSFD
jgi:hypothetical protein